MSNNVGPVCHIPPANTPGDPQPRDIPGLPGPVSPNDPNGMAALLNAMRLIMLQLAGQLNKNNGTKSSPPKKKVQWKETNRVTANVKIFQNNDPSTGNFVEVEQINSLTMTDKSSGNTWVWSRGGG